MSWRARALLLVLAARHIAVGALCLATAELFTSTSFTMIRRLLPLEVWGAITLVIGFQAIGAAWTGGERWARWVLVASSAITAAWTAGFVSAAFAGLLDAPSIPVTWAALVAKDLILSATPLRTPLEDVVRRLEE
jgi:hypothetical protein